MSAGFGRVAGGAGATAASTSAARTASIVEWEQKKSEVHVAVVKLLMCANCPHILWIDFRPPKKRCIDPFIPLEMRLHSVLSPGRSAAR